jgi:hypothetical protein
MSASGGGPQPMVSCLFDLKKRADHKKQVWREHFFDRSLFVSRFCLPKLLEFTWKI